jgi:hypothetical protein
MGPFKTGLEKQMTERKLHVGTLFKQHVQGQSKLLGTAVATMATALQAVGLDESCHASVSVFGQIAFLDAVKSALKKQPPEKLLACKTGVDIIKKHCGKWEELGKLSLGNFRHDFGDVVRSYIIQPHEDSTRLC